MHYETIRVPEYWEIKNTLGNKLNTANKRFGMESIPDLNDYLWIFGTKIIDQLYRNYRDCAVLRVESDGIPRTLVYGIPFIIDRDDSLKIELVKIVK